MVKGVFLARPEQTAELKYLAVQQLPTIPIPPAPIATSFGTISWDLPKSLKYTPLAVIDASLQMVNPTSEQRLYSIGYYYLDPNGVVVDDGIVVFKADSFEFKAFYLPAGGANPAFTVVSFSAPDTGYTFGLRMLLLEMTDSVAVVIKETSRLEVLLTSGTENWNLLGSLMVPAVLLMFMAAMGAMMVKSVRRGEK